MSKVEKSSAASTRVQVSMPGQWSLSVLRDSPRIPYRSQIIRAQAPSVKNTSVCIKHESVFLFVLRDLLLNRDV